MGPVVGFDQILQNNCVALIQAGHEQRIEVVQVLRQNNLFPGLCIGTFDVLEERRKLAHGPKNIKNCSIQNVLVSLEFDLTLGKVNAEYVGDHIDLLDYHVLDLLLL